MSARSESGRMCCGPGISRSVPPFAAPSASCTAPQSDIMMPGKPHSDLATSTSRRWFAVMYVPFVMLYDGMIAPTFASFTAASKIGR